MRFLLSTLLLTLTTTSFAAPVELGAVHWVRSLDSALATSETNNKPVLILFQEVPGCSTCRNYGSDILNHPLIVEAIEDLFIPVAIFNNRGGADAETLKAFREPAWNNPVVRIIDADRNALVERVSGDYTQLGLVNAMVDALQKSKHEVPSYLSNLQQELLSTGRRTESAVFAMGCFWSGESKLGALDGVVQTRPGFLGGHEVVAVRFDPQLVAYDELVKEAKSLRCTRKVFARSKEQLAAAARHVGDDAELSDTAIRPDAEPKYYLAQTSYRFVPMTPMQAARANGAIGRRAHPNQFLSPRQQELLDLAEGHPGAGWKSVVGQNDLATAWQEAQRVAVQVRGKRPAIRITETSSVVGK